ncbi:MAG: sigma-70 family RNA polymerase sigma factor [Candidatus Marinimicrobia bacterium]|jgi:RNA polymerase sigma-70 factor (ECF subfamily)|nr:sigma-70 family RNA polymerase sigma factor [Candidatus Neomarinimicrobiota bacterium]MBT3633231.1 sigma-70 family RNA polymerase sigma factor [Candidatus Neomarinimicrobiota bacterium]MBT3682168.1 sigma-70 family RNA polymerase sigma factor [Candidatus Neomarinimicrobiota bacterium]MBT3758831.1 sigma-70 family RNA polymerase sigma factor [Candidatus Neomarinimicrobiota bacterium]MBT3895294.1 sigma-70 family RNA polymerase sigma factor [Candidatus Neomarinimicrobiota bacterium]
MKTDEIVLIEKAQSGDREALTSLITQYSSRIYNLGLRMMRNEKDAEDILQETFLILIKKINTFQGRSSLYTWLYRVATNLALEKLKDKHRTHVTASIDDLGFDNFQKYHPVEFPEFTDEKLSDRQFRRYLNKAMIELNEKLKAVFVLRDIEGQSVAETAKILAITESNVKIRLMRARLFLRDKLSHTFSKEGWL